MSSITLKNITQLSRPIMAIGFSIGLILSLSVLSGDNSGRVNLLYLLIVFLVIPLVGAALSIVSLLGEKGVNAARLCSLIPLWTKSQKDYLHKIRQHHIDKEWFFLQSQAAALAYSAASLLVFLVLLLTTDINFVWRSTLLDAEQLKPLLTLIAIPWFFWDTAQPSIELLRATQDSRLTQAYSDVSGFGQWWAFVLATQLTYSFMLRGLLLAVAKVWLRKLTKNDVEQRLARQRIQSPNNHSPVYPLAPIKHELPIHYALNNWAGLNEKELSQLALQPSQVLHSTPLETQQFDGVQLLLVKAWEPPMGELQDYMLQGRGLLFAINYKNDQLIAPETKHLEEWQRFIEQVPNWCIYLPTQWTTQDA